MANTVVLSNLTLDIEPKSQNMTEKFQSKSGQ